MSLADDHAKLEKRLRKLLKEKRKQDNKNRANIGMTRVSKSEFEQSFAAEARENPESVLPEIEEADPGLLPELQRLQAKHAAVRQNTAQHIAHRFGRVTSIDQSKIDPGELQREIGAAILGDNPREEARAQFARILARSDESGFVDALNRGELTDEDFQAAMTVPVEKNPYEDFTAAQLEKMLGGESDDHVEGDRPDNVAGITFPDAK